VGEKPRKGEEKWNFEGGRGKCGSWPPGISRGHCSDTAGFRRKKKGSDREKGNSRRSLITIKKRVGKGLLKDRDTNVGGKEGRALNVSRTSCTVEVVALLEMPEKKKKGSGLKACAVRRTAITRNTDRAEKKKRRAKTWAPQVCLEEPANRPPGENEAGGTNKSMSMPSWV